MSRRLRYSGRVNQRVWLSQERFDWLRLAVLQIPRKHWRAVTGGKEPFIVLRGVCYNLEQGQ